MSRHITTKITDELAEKFIQEAEKAGLFTRQYEGIEYCRDLCRAARSLWWHMSALDLGNLTGWEGCKELANAYARADGPGLRTF